MKILWLVLISKKNQYLVHSVHKDESQARSWMECKSRA